MSNFKPVDYDVEFAKSITTEAPMEPTSADKIVAAINIELEKIGRGSSKLTANAVQMRPGSTPFLNTLSAFQAEPSLDNAKKLVAMANQDLGHLFGEFVKALVAPLFEKK